LDSVVQAHQFVPVLDQLLSYYALRIFRHPLSMVEFGFLLRFDDFIGGSSGWLPMKFAYGFSG